MTILLEEIASSPDFLQNRSPLVPWYCFWHQRSIITDWGCWTCLLEMSSKGRGDRNRLPLLNRCLTASHVALSARSSNHASISARHQVFGAFLSTYLHSSPLSPSHHRSRAVCKLLAASDEISPSWGPLRQPIFRFAKKMRTSESVPAADLNSSPAPVSRRRDT